MTARQTVFIIAALMLAVTVASAQQGATDPLQASFQKIVDDLNDNKTNSFVKAVDTKGMLDVIYSKRLIDQRVQEQFSETFDGQVKTMFTSSFPPSEGVILGKLVSFERQGDRATAVVRFDLSAYAYVYREFELRAGSGDSVRVEDWVDFFTGERLTDAVGDSLAMAMPGDSQTRSLLSPLQLTEVEIFQTRELFKAIRDKDAQRYFEILPGLDPRIQRHELVARTSVMLARAGRDKAQYRAALTIISDYYGGEPRYSAMLLDYQLPRKQYEQALLTLQRLKARLKTEDAAINSQLATLELILGNVDSASTHAEAAVSAEPGSELAWWAVLRTRTAAGQFDQAVEALAVLEDEFGHKLKGDALGRDSGLAKLLETDQYKAWKDAEKS